MFLFQIRFNLHATIYLSVCLNFKKNLTSFKYYFGISKMDGSMGTLNATFFTTTFSEN